ncbi:enoyl-CoA hydratase [Acuticoccus sediminis]|uniref:Enoyl-CoA hydratase n=1 Tax=Acuticoccus sediminis TaxID=2184697 RepID=A0A8B2NNS8_9HYPH|nr:enoyl-CoA hydratase-related protein [Acuticoccus sediminis]RAH98367.1 enoyl-CoA hydratase [Acuticoccus sediminis]
MSPIDITRDGAVATLTINRPETLNAIDVPTIKAFHAALDEVEADDGVRVVLFTGAGRAFIAGGDIADLNSRQGLAHYSEFAEDIHRLFRRIEIFDKPTVAAVNGFALGGGTEILLAIDIRILSDKARLGLPEINLGLFPGAGGTQRIIRQLPLCRAKEIMFTGDMLSADEAVAVGLANRVVPHDTLMSEAMATCEKIASKSPLTLKLLKRTLVAGGDMPLAAALAHEQAMIGLVLDAADAHEGCSAFLEKRAPSFKGV